MVYAYVPPTELEDVAAAPTHRHTSIQYSRLLEATDVYGYAP